MSYLPGDMMLSQLLSNSCQMLHFQNYIWQSVEHAKNSLLWILSFLLHILCQIMKGVYSYQRKFSMSYKINSNLSWTDTGRFFFLFFFSCIQGIWKFPGQGSNPSHSCDLRQQHWIFNLLAISGTLGRLFLKLLTH